MNAKEEIANLKNVINGWSTEPEVIADFIRWNNRFHKYSPFNRLMIKAQRPNATRCASYGDWQKLGRQPKGKGTGIAIFVPYFKNKTVIRNGKEVEEDYVSGYGVKTTFDISNTVSIDKDNDEYEKLVAEIDIPKHSYDELLEFTRFIAKAAGIQWRVMNDGISHGFIAADERQVIITQSLVESEQVLAELIALVAITITHKDEKLVHFGHRSEFVGNIDVKGIAIPVDFRTSATAWAIADRFGVDVTPQIHTILANPVIGDDEEFNRVLTSIAQSLKMFDQIENGVPFEWAQAYMDASKSR